jgi:hypothetical protein
VQTALRTIGFVVLAAAIVVVWQGPEPARAKDSRTISIAQQLRLQRKLLGDAESFVAVLRANRAQWDRYGPEQQNIMRQRAYAFRDNTPPQQQQAILDAWKTFHRLDGAGKQRRREQAARVKRVLDALPEEQRDQLRKLSPAERAREILRLERQMPGTVKPTPAPSPEEAGNDNTDEARAEVDAADA